MEKVYVAILNQGHNQAGLESTLIQWMNEYVGKYKFNFFPSKYTYRPISANRNRIVKDFLETDYDILVMIDDDNPPIQNIFKLIEYDKDVMGVPVPIRDDNGIKWSVFNYSESYPKEVKYVAFPLDKRHGLQRVGAISSGVLIVKRKVLERVKKPFEDRFDENGCIINSDDMYFAYKVDRAGFEIWTNFDYYCSHYKTVDLLQMLKFQNMMYELGENNGIKKAQGREVKKISMTEFIDKYGKKQENKN
jgi:hypothetical protein